MFMVYFVFIWIRATWPRVRVDQILNFNWKFLVPLSLVLILTIAVLDKVIPASAGIYYRSSILLLANLIIAMIAVEIMRNVARRKRKESSGDAAMNVSEAVYQDTHDAMIHIMRLRFGTLMPAMLSREYSVNVD